MECDTCILNQKNVLQCYLPLLKITFRILIVTINVEINVCYFILHSKKVNDDSLLTHS